MIEGGDLEIPPLQSLNSLSRSFSGRGGGIGRGISWSVFAHLVLLHVGGLRLLLLLLLFGLLNRDLARLSRGRRGLRGHSHSGNSEHRDNERDENLLHDIPL